MSFRISNVIFIKRKLRNNAFWEIKQARILFFGQSLNAVDFQKVDGIDWKFTAVFIDTCFQDAPGVVANQGLIYIKNVWDFPYLPEMKKNTEQSQYNYTARISAYGKLPEPLAKVKNRVSRKIPDICNID